MLAACSTLLRRRTAEVPGSGTVHATQCQPVMGRERVGRELKKS